MEDYMMYVIDFQRRIISDFFSLASKRIDKFTKYNSKADGTESINTEITFGLESARSHG